MKVSKSRKSPIITSEIRARLGTLIHDGRGLRLEDDCGSLRTYNKAARTSIGQCQACAEYLMKNADEVILLLHAYQKRRIGK